MTERCENHECTIKYMGKRLWYRCMVCGRPVPEQLPEPPQAIEIETIEQGEAEQWGCSINWQK